MGRRRLRLRGWALLLGVMMIAGAAAAPAGAQAPDEHDGAVASALQTLPGIGPRIAFARSVSTRAHDPFRSEVFTVAEDGTGLTRLTDNDVEDNHPAFSPDGQRIAFTSSRRGTPSIYVMNADGSRVRRLTTGPKSDAMPDWSPDGKWVVFTRTFPKQRQSDILRVRVADGVTRRVTRTPARELRPAWSPDGKLIAFTKLLDAKERYGIAVIRPEGYGTRWLTRNPRSRAGLVDEAPTWSPGGTHVAFAREATQRTSDLYTVRRDGTGVRRLTSAGGSAQMPSWGADGRILAVHNGTLATVDAAGTGLRALVADTGAAARPYTFPDWGHAASP